jgi:peptidoglycan/xylan/chitin deacetylase (PgdA/CDA1 family)
MTSWPNGCRCAVSVGFDNLGEAAEIEMGLRPADAPMGGHPSVTSALPVVLRELDEAGLAATFFVEGVNAEAYPDALRGIAGAGHEIAFHAWRHEEWSRLGTEAETANLTRGLDALRGLGLEVRGFRPPGGLLGPDTLHLLAGCGLDYCSPAGSRAGVDRVVVLPFDWLAVDVFHVIPPFAALRKTLTGSEDAGGVEAVESHLLAAVESGLARGGHVSLGCHTWIAEFELDALRVVLARVRDGVAAGDIWAARHDEVAQWITEHAQDFAQPPVLDRTSWLTG